MEENPAFGAAGDPPGERDRALSASAAGLVAELAVLEAGGSTAAEVLALALERLLGYVPCQTVSVVRVHGDEVEFVAAAGLRPPALKSGQRVPYPAPHQRRLLLDCGHAFRDYGGPNEVERLLREAGLRSGVSLGLVAGGELLGVLSLGSESPGFFTEARAQALRPVATQLALCLLRADAAGLSAQHAARVDELMAELAASQQLVESRVEERTRTLQNAYDHVRELDRAKTVFLSTITHELKTPLVTVTGYLEMALRGQLGPIEPRQRRAFDTALRNTRRLDHLIDDVLDLTRLELGRYPIQSAPFELERAVDDALGAVAIAAQEKHIVLSREVPVDLWVQGDSQRIVQVLTNLLANAIKFSTEGEPVRVTAALLAGGERVELVVADQGIGIAPALHEHIFESFFQVDGSATRRHGGAGLGLAIVRSILAAHATGITLESAPGAGARFSFSLALSQRERAVDAGLDDVSLPASSARPPAGARVLVVEDEYEIQEFVRLVLEMEGLRVLQAWSGVEGLAVAEREHPDYVLLDISMVGMSGIEVCRLLKAHPTLGTVPVIILSARTAKEDKQASFAAGADAFIPKPFSPAELLRALSPPARRR